MDRGSGIRVEVAFDNPSVFAGDELIAVISLKNVSKSATTVNNSNTQAESNAGRQSISVEEEYYTPTARLAALGLGGLAPNDVNNSGSRSEDNIQVSSSNSSTFPRRASFSNGISEMYNGTLRDSSAPKLSISRMRPTHRRQESLSSKPEQLLMGFAQLQGYFKIDDEIIDSSMLEDIKRQGVIVGKNGLEYGINPKENVGSASKFFSDLASGFGGLLSVGLESPATGPGSESSSLGPIPENPSKYGAGAAKIILKSDDHMGHDDFPIFSTPQSLLFVDLKLEPGESKSFCYKMRIPKKLPPSYRGKALRIHYNLVIGTQRSIGHQSSPVPKLVFFPFRVFPYVDGNGGQPVYNFEKPIVLHEDSAVVKTLSGRRASSKSFEWLREAKLSIVKDTKASLLAKNDFLDYVNKLLDPDTLVSQEAANLPVNFALLRKRSELRFDSSQELLDSSKTENGYENKDSDNDKMMASDYSAKDNIDFYFQYKHAQMGLKRNFDIAKNGKYVTTVSLSKPAYRVGEEIIVGLNFSSPECNYDCHHVTASLETIETIDESVVKSDSLAQGYRIYSQGFTSTFSTDKIYLALNIPPTSSPQFATSLLSLSWSLKIDFVLSPKTSDNSSPLISNEPAPNLHNTGKYQCFSANAKIPCESLSCRIMLNVLPTNQDIGAIVDHSLQRRRCFI